MKLKIGRTEQQCTPCLISLFSPENGVLTLEYSYTRTSGNCFSTFLVLFFTHTLSYAQYWRFINFNFHYGYPTMLHSNYTITNCVHVCVHTLAQIHMYCVCVYLHVCTCIKSLYFLFVYALLVNIIYSQNIKFSVYSQICLLGMQAVIAKQETYSLYPKILLI